MTFEAENPLVSIIVPMYNVGEFARPCVTSLLALGINTQGTRG